ncbi:HTH-type transcriptional activator IlvY [Marinobacterium sp. D7]|uniref:HTH-type transcriptional activator IlvY n=1 Tax=Marinobacterium ramblicola TaxID=2849041 RepID=UPI001C2D9949|nr:HTH-type transcriptional activator IlvY [Marinobacterium ramblicola]MBV1790746.1 HTH-type transcriptional activator IlvY [Marinobacterium ramblicola]
MDTKPLRLFLALADSLHFGRAAESCHVSPSTLSRSIKLLEEELGVDLFERDNRSVELTREGERFQAYARDTLAQWDLIRNSLLEDAKELHGEISVYCSVTASYSFLYQMLRKFRRQYPRVEIKLHTGDPEHAIGHVLSGSEEISIAARPDTLNKGLAFRPIGVTPLLFIAPLERHEQIPDTLPFSRQQWQEIPLILSESGVARNRVNQWFSERGIKPRIYAQVAGNEAIVSMVSLGFGIGVVPRIVLDNSPLADRVRVLEIKPELEPYEIGLFALEKKLRSPLINAFWSLP